MYLRQNVSSITSEQSTERYGVAGYPAPMSRSYLAWALAEQGRFKESTSLGEQALELARTLNHPWSEVTTVWGLAMVYLIQARFESAIDLLEDALERLNHWHLLALTPGIMGGLGYARVKTGQIPDGLKMLEEALNDAETSGRLAFHSVLCVFHAEAILLTGNENAARLAVQKSLTHARERGERGVEAWALKLVADIEFQCCPSGSDKARQNYQSAFTLASELNMQPLIAHCQYGMGLDRQRMGQIKQSSKHLQAARKLYAEMQMQSCLELVNNLLAGLDFSGMDCH